MISLKTTFAGLAAALVCSTSALAQDSAVIDRIKERGYVTCGASTGVPGLSRADDDGVWRGFDSDICRTVAVALLGDKDAIRFVPLITAQRLPALQTGEIDILSRTTTWTMSRDTVVRFVWTTLYDGEAIMHRSATPVSDVKDLDGMTFCVTGGGNLGEVSLTNLEREHNISVERVMFQNPQETRDTYLAERCDAYITDAVAAAGTRASVAKNPDDHEIFIVPGEPPEPLAVAVARGDDSWFDVTRYAIAILWWAEDHGITSANVDEFVDSDDPSIRRVLGEDGFGAPLGLDDKWAYNVIKQLGNYGEIFERNLGMESPLKLQRNLNRLYKDGGVFAPVFID